MPKGGFITTVSLQPPLQRHLPHVAPKEVDRQCLLVFVNVLLRYSKGIVIKVNAQHMLRSQHGGTDAQHRRATAKVNHSLSVKLVKAVAHRVEHSCCYMGTSGILLQLYFGLFKWCYVLHERLQLFQPHGNGLRAAPSECCCFFRRERIALA